MTLARLFAILTWIAIEASVVGIFVNRGATRTEDSLFMCMGIFDAFVITTSTFVVAWRAFEIRSRNLSAAAKVNQILFCVVPFGCGLALALHAMWAIVGADDVYRYRIDYLIRDLRVPTAILISGFGGSIAALSISTAFFLTCNSLKEEECRTKE